MQLFDSRLRFARELVAHWIQIRPDGLVPCEKDIDPRALLAAWPDISIMDISSPETAIVEFMKSETRERYGRDVRKANWFDFIPAEQRASAEEIRRLLISVPCGVYYAFATAKDSDIRWEAETLVLPMTRNRSEAPSLSIALTRDISIAGVMGPSPEAPLTLDRFFAELVDIGAGVPTGYSG